MIFVSSILINIQVTKVHGMHLRHKRYGKYVETLSVD